MYAPNCNPDRDDFFAFCESAVDPSVPTLLCGNFNAVFDRCLDRRGSNVFDSTRESSAALSSLFNECCVSDVRHVLHPGLSGFSWTRSDGSLASRIDLIGCPFTWLHCMQTFTWLHCMQTCDLLSCPFSDHSAVLLKCPIPEPLPRGPGCCKFNASILSDEAFVTSFKTFWSCWHLCKNSFGSLLEWWDRGKEKIKGLVISFRAGRNNESKQSRELLVNLATHLKSKIDLGQVSLLDVYESVQSRIADIDLAAARDA